MFRTLHRIEIDIVSVPYRGCRPYQEKIYEFSPTGKRLFEWDKMRERYLLRGTPLILEICQPCAMNIFGGVEGCRGEVEGLTIFLKVLLHLKPDSSIFKHRFQNEYMTHDQTRAFLTEMTKVQELMAETEWPIAQVLVNGEPKTVQGPRNFAYYEWEGDEDDTFIFSNDGYSVGIAKDGLIVKDAGGHRQPYLFSSLSRVQTCVFGETIEGQRVDFDPVRDASPAWDDEPEWVDTQLAYAIVPASDIFSDLLEVFTCCAETALRHNTGLRINQLG